LGLAGDRHVNLGGFYRDNYLAALLFAAHLPETRGEGRMKLVVANLASPANPGDQAILRGALKLLRATFQDPEIFAVTRAYSEKTAYEALGCHAVPHYPDVECLASDSPLQKLFNIPRALLNPSKLVAAIKQADVVFTMGGAYYYSYRKLAPGFTYLSHFSAVALAQFFHKPVIFLPQSYGPFQSWIAQSLFDWAVHTADFIFYREEITGEWMRRRYPALAHKYGFMPDLAFNLEHEDVLPRFQKNTPAGRVGLTIRAWEASERNQHDYLKALVEALSRLYQDHHMRIRVIVQVQDPKKGEGDEWISRELALQLEQRLGKDAVELCTAQPYFKLPEICKLYQQCDFLIGMRLHSALLSFIAGRPAMVAGYQHKAEGILKKLGLEGLYMGAFHQLDAPALQRACESMLTHQEMWARKIEMALANARSEIRRTFAERMKQLTL
jgi:polysaccharide pyruvyl transferase WcaK-like protein